MHPHRTRPSTPRTGATPPRGTTGLLPERGTTPLLAALAVGLLVSGVVAVSVGAVDLDPLTVWRIVVAELTGAPVADGIAPNVRQIVWELRVPRVVMAMIVGAGLAVVGVAIQALVRNPLADPYVLGVSSGASVGAALVILFGLFGGFGSAAISLAAFVTAAITMLILYSVAQEGGRLQPTRLVLMGVVLGYVASAITSFIVFRGDPRGAQQVLFWLLGSFGRARWSLLIIPAVLLVVVLVWLLLRARPLDALQVGDHAAVTLGVGVGRLRIELFVVTAALTAVLVAVSGAVGFVGLVIPHIVRLLVGGLHRRVIPTAALLGGVFMVWVDVAARVLAAPEEIPLGILTAFIGGPLFVLLMRHRDRRDRIAA